MTYVVTEACINCKHTDCVDVCPVDCFVEGPNFLAITEKKAAPGDAEHWVEVKKKRNLLELA